MAAFDRRPSWHGRQSLLAAGVIHFALEDGEARIVAPEERRTYDHIIYSNVGDFPITGLTDTQVKGILSHSHLPENDLENVWSLTTTIDAEGLPNGGWSHLEVYVALHLVQQYERLNLNEMAVQFAGSLPPVAARKIIRRSSYAQAGPATIPVAADPAIPTATSPAPWRTQSLAGTPTPPPATLLRHARTEGSTTARLRHLRSQQTISSSGHSSINQPGLETMDSIREISEWTHHIPSPPLRRSRQGVSGIDIGEASNEAQAVLRESSIRTNTVDRAARLATLIRTRCPEVVIGRAIEAPEPRDYEVSIPDQHHARVILVKNRNNNTKFKDHLTSFPQLLKSKESKKRASDTQNWNFDEGELSHALQEAVAVSGHVGVAKEIIDMGADVNLFKEAPKSKFKGLGSKGVISKPFNYIQIAASKNDVEMVNLLASRGTSQSNLAKALEKAVCQSLPKVVLALLQYGADPNAFGGAIFQSAIASQKPVIVGLLLRARTPVDKRLLTSSLPIAVAQGHAELVSLLVLYEADVNSDHGLALRKAVQAQRTDLVLAIMKGKPTSDTVSSIIEDAMSVGGSSTIPEKYLLLEILLCGGAKGDSVAEILVRVVREGHRGIAELLIKHGASLKYKNAKALSIAVSAENVEVLTTLLHSRIDKKTASDLFDEIPRPFQEGVTYHLMSILISKGASGSPLNKALVVAVQQKLAGLIGLLLDHKASVDYNDAQALQMAVTAGDLDTLNLLLTKGRAQPQSMQYLLPRAPPSPPQLKYAITKSIIQFAAGTGLPSSILDAALIEAVSPRSHELDMDLVDLLIRAGANTACREGECFQVAVRKGLIELLELLIRNASQLTSLHTAVPVAMRLEQKDVRRKILRILVDYGTQGPDVDQALHDAIVQNPMDKAMILPLLTKANVDYRGGQALIMAVRCSTRDIVAAVIDMGKPGPQSRLAALSAVLEPATKDREAKLILLLQAGIDPEGLNKALVQEISNEPNGSIGVIKMLLDFKASCNYNGGRALELAIIARDSKLLELLVTSKPDRYILGSMLPVAMHNVDSATKHTSMAILLRGGAKGEQISSALIQEICGSRTCDRQLLKLLIKHGASVDNSDGKAIKHVVLKALHIDLLRILVTGKGASNILSSLIPLAMRHSEDQRLPILHTLLQNGAQGPELDAALVDAVSEGPASQATIDLLLENNASVNFNHGEAIRRASAAGSSSILQCLLERKPKLRYLPEALKLAMQAPSTQPGSSTPMRLPSIRLLTQAGVKGSETIHEALIEAVRERDYNLVEHLIQSGGDPNFMDGRSVIIATEQSDIHSLTLLAKSAPTPEVFSAAFNVTTQNANIQHPEAEHRLKIAKVLLDGGAAGPAVDRAFVNALASSRNFAAQFTNMVLTCQTPLDVNFDKGRCLCVAAKKNLFELVEYLFKQSPSEQTLCSAFMSVFESDAGERSLIKMTQLFFQYSKEAKKKYFQQDDPSMNPLYQTLHRHGDKPELLQTLLYNGCRLEYRFPWEFIPGTGAEETSPLLWLLCQGGECTDAHTVKILLQSRADPNFRTSSSGNSPLIIAAASSQPKIVLQLLEAHAEPNTEDSVGRTPLHYSTGAGDLESMGHLLHHRANPDDESLHVAAQNLHTSAAKLLLEHDASVDWPGLLSFDGRTPLGELCQNADPERDPAQLKNMLKLLAMAGSNPKRLVKDKSILFFALDNNSGLKMTKALLATFPALRESINDDFNICKKKSGLCYSPTMYVRHFKCKQSLDRRSLDRKYACCNLDGCPARALEDLLRNFSCIDRFWDEKAGANQPPAACGLPTHFREEVEEAERLRKQEAEQARLRKEEKAHHDAIQAKLDAAEEAKRRREEKRLALIEQEREAEAREARRQISLVEERRRADAREERRRISSLENERNAEKERRESDFRDQQEHRRLSAKEEERRIKRKNSINAARLREEARITKDVLDKKKRAVDSVTEMFRQAQISGIGERATGRILGEFEEEGRYLT